MDSASSVSYRLPSGITIQGVEWGDSSSNHRILALHGWLDNAATWHLVGPVLAKQGFHVVAVDFAGHGRSSHRSLDAPYLALHYVEDTMMLLVAMGWLAPSDLVPAPRPSAAADSSTTSTPATSASASSASDSGDAAEGAPSKKPILLGHSMGAGIAAMMAGSFPRAFSGIALVESVGLMSEEGDRLPRRLAKGVAELGAATLKAAKARSSGAAAGRVYPGLEAAAAARQANARAIGGQKLSMEASLALATRGVISTPGGDDLVTFAHDRRAQVSSALYMTEAQVGAFFAGTQVPMLVLLGKEGIPFPEDRVASRLDLVPSAVTRVSLPGFHHLHADPDTAGDVSKALVDWLDASGLSA